MKNLDKWLHILCEFTVTYQVNEEMHEIETESVQLNAHFIKRLNYLKHSKHKVLPREIVNNLAFIAALKYFAM